MHLNTDLFSGYWGGRLVSGVFRLESGVFRLESGDFRLESGVFRLQLLSAFLL